MSLTFHPVCWRIASLAHDPTWISQGQIASGAGLGANLWLTVDYLTLTPHNKISGLYDCEPSSADPLTQALLISANKCDIAELTHPLSTTIHFADLNGDGRTEYLYVDGSGGVTAFLNLGGPDNGPNAARISWLPQGVIASGVGANRSSVRFGDLNGDGRAEYIYVNTDGSVEAYLNLGGPDNGANAAKVSCLPQGTIATGVGQGRDNVVVADINGDRRADYLASSRTDGSTMA
ncbi:uncharacterized protein K444DRAFT_706964 [Hyaloscypha bicolor E]|uniref:Integrin alpha N-terminal domain-containing protein n=1 Tax=Hyaloscypha bicolor E TaxID=1095630 RepID=A0A2J6SJZ5_9HELO|nr:uncharacterized protein K444DRAFT_706964 [Hyaloscypha bicolor E]PMD51086.1 hypothetical protein K444DRAFT_706964 [Hyaloscypha bicolor E]